MAEVLRVYVKHNDAYAAHSCDSKDKKGVAKLQKAFALRTIRMCRVGVGGCVRCARTPCVVVNATV